MKIGWNSWRNLKEMLGNVRDRLSDLFFVLFCAVIIGMLLVIHFSHYDLFNGSADSACYLLSALAQSQAAIVAIVVTLTLVAVQLASQTYSPRVMDLFLKNRQFWILLFIYGISIMYDFVLLSMIPPQAPDAPLNVTFCILRKVELGIEDLIVVGLVLMAITFSALFLYIPWLMGLLKPKKLIKALRNEIMPNKGYKKERVNKFVENVWAKYDKYREKYSPRLLWKDDESMEESDEILPLIDVVKRVIRADDSSAAVVGISGLKEVCCSIIEDNKIESSRKEGIVNHFSEHFIRISRVAFSQNDEDSVIEIAESLGKIGENAIDKRWIKNEDIAFALMNIGMEIIDKGWTKATQSVAETFKNIYVKAKERSHPGSDSIILSCFGNIIWRSMEKDMDFAVEYTIKALKDAIIKIIEMDLDPHASWRLVRPFNNIIDESTKVIKKERPKIARWMGELIGYLVEIGIKSENTRAETKKVIREELRKEISHIVDEIGDIKDYVPDNSGSIDEWIKSYIISSLGDVGLQISSGDGFVLRFDFTEYKIKNPRDAIEWIAVCLIDIGLKTRRKDFESATESVMDFLVKGIEKNCDRIEQGKLINDVFEMYPQIVETTMDSEAFEKLKQRRMAKLGSDC